MQVDPTDAGSKAYCTYFDSRYLPRAKAMILSLRSVGEHGPVLASKATGPLGSADNHIELTDCFSAAQPLLFSQFVDEFNRSPNHD